MINQGGGKKSGGWEAQGGPSHPPDFDREVAPPSWTPLETASEALNCTNKVLHPLKKNVLDIFERIKLN
jgi:hypothetical protein